MPIIPFAKRLLIPPGSNDPRIIARAGVLHVDAGNNPSLYEYFRDRSGGIESHGHIQLDGDLEQYRDTDYEADANHLANPFALSFETQGYGDGEWTDPQLATIKRCIQWAKDEHQIPMREIDRWNGSGWGYHVKFGAPGYWTPVAKSCPGYRRIEQYKDILVPWMATAGKPEPEPVRYENVRHAHVSMEAFDSADQKRKDCDKIFARAARRNFRWVTGTEAGEQPLEGILEAAAEPHGFRVHNKRGDWIAVRREFVKGGWEQGFVPVIESHEGKGKHSDRGIPWVSFETHDLGRITVGSGHWLTDGRAKGQPNFGLNAKMVTAVGKWAEDKGAGKDLVFYQADHNVNDKKVDVFRGEPLTTYADHLKKHQNTGYGPIDGISFFNRDGRADPQDFRVFDDEEFKLFTDHYFLVAVTKIRFLA